MAIQWNPADAERDLHIADLDREWDRMTRDRLEAAQRANADERARFTQQTGIALDDDGQMLGLRIANAIAFAVGPKR